MSDTSPSHPNGLREPGPDHPIVIRPAAHRVVVRAGGRVIADSGDALSLAEASYPAVLYIPRDDVDMGQLTRLTRKTVCPYKGDCSYYGLQAQPDSPPLAWSYETPGTQATKSIAGHIAFYKDRVDSVGED